MAYSPDSMIAEAQSSFVDLWSRELPVTEKILHFLSSQNLATFARGHDQVATFQRLEAFLSRLLRSGIIPPLVLEDQCMAILHHEWPKVSRCPFPRFETII